MWDAEKSTWPHHESSRFVDAGGVRWHVQVAGCGPAVLLIHGTGASTHTWRPDAATWSLIKQHSVKAPATITITGYADSSQNPASEATVHIDTSTDPVGAPVFYRDVPLLLPSPSEKGPIAPLAASAIPLIQWRIRNLGEPESHTVMGNLPTCANCHSFSRDGKTFGLDLDGPKNDKGLYALVPVEKNMTITSKNVIR